MEVTLQPIHMHPSLITTVKSPFDNCGDWTWNLPLERKGCYQRANPPVRLYWFAKPQTCLCVDMALHGCMEEPYVTEKIEVDQKS